MRRDATRLIDALPSEVLPAGGTITEKDLRGLPPPAQRYFRCAGVVGKPRVASFSFVLRGRIRRGPESRWMSFESRQYNLLSAPSRVFHIRTVRGLLSGVDSYVGGRGRMRIKLLGLITVADSSGPRMDRSGLVTFLNDLLFCPLGCFSLALGWRGLDERRVELSLSHGGSAVTGVLSVDEAGRPLNWESEDRFADIRGRPVPDRWSTPMSAWGEVAGLRIPVVGQGVHDLGNGSAWVYTEIEAVEKLAWNHRGLPPGRGLRAPAED